MKALPGCSPQQLPNSRCPGPSSRGAYAPAKPVQLSNQSINALAPSTCSLRVSLSPHANPADGSTLSSAIGASPPKCRPTATMRSSASDMQHRYRRLPGRFMTALHRCPIAPLGQITQLNERVKQFDLRVQMSHQATLSSHRSQIATTVFTAMVVLGGQSRWSLRKPVVIPYCILVPNRQMTRQKRFVNPHSIPIVPPRPSRSILLKHKN
jgi:hypothetical protein